VVQPSSLEEHVRGRNGFLEDGSRCIHRSAEYGGDPCVHTRERRVSEPERKADLRADISS